MAPKKLMKFVVFAVVSATISKLVKGMKQGMATSTDGAKAGTADQWPPVPRREDG